MDVYGPLRVNHFPGPEVQKAKHNLRETQGKDKVELGCGGSSGASSKLFIPVGLAKHAYVSKYVPPKCECVCVCLCFFSVGFPYQGEMESKYEVESEDRVFCALSLCDP